MAFPKVAKLETHEEVYGPTRGKDTLVVDVTLVGIWTTDPDPNDPDADVPDEVIRMVGEPRLKPLTGTP